MQTTDTETTLAPATTPDSPSGLTVTTGDLFSAYAVVLGKLKSITEKAAEFVDACVHAGKLLSKKRDELKGSESNFKTWIEQNQAETGFSRTTAYRLMAIYEARVSGPKHELSGPITSVEQAYLLLRDSEKEATTETQTTKPASGDREVAAIAKFKSAISGFWKAITHRPPDAWKPEEKSEFALDLRARAALVSQAKISADGITVREDGVIEIEVEEVK